MTPWKLACFDLDGTLIRNTSSGIHLAAKIGHEVEMRKMEALYAEGKVSNADVAAMDARHYRGYNKNDIDKFLDDIPVIRDIAVTVEHLSKLGIPSIICTLAWDVVAESFAKRYGFVKWSGAGLEADDMGIFTGNVRSDFLETDKPIFVRKLCDEFGISMQEVFHVGDSRSDIPLFREVAFSIALNGNSLAKSAASVSLESESLLDVLKLVPELLPSPEEKASRFL